MVIDVLNVNDMKPRFKEDSYHVLITEEQVPTFPVIAVSAVDPDIGDEAGDQNITYYLDQVRIKAFLTLFFCQHFTLRVQRGFFPEN